MSISSPRGVVLKFGGAAVATIGQFARITEIIALRRKVFERVVVVVSAMGKTTDDLIALAHQVHPDPPKRELDMLVSAGERMSMALLSMALQARGLGAQSFTGSQAGIITTEHHTEARIIEVRPQRLERSLAAQKITIVAGFQGMSTAGEITTLGRGGSDTSAVALALGLRCGKVEFYKDVPGIFDADPKTVPCAQLLGQLDWQAARKLIEEKMAKILHARCLKLAQKNLLPLQVLPFAMVQDDALACKITPAFGTIIGNAPDCYLDATAPNPGVFYEEQENN